MEEEITTSSYTLMSKSGMSKKDDTLVWKKNLKNLERFKMNHSHCNVPEDYAPDPSLAVWVKNIRAHRKKLPQWVEEALLKLKFDFEYKPSSWDYYYNQLKAFHRTHHHIYIQSRDKAYSSLYQWTAAIRDSKTKLTKAQRDSLDKLGFEWEAQSRNKLWELRLQELSDFRKENGHVIVPKSMKTLNRWIHDLRKREADIPKERKKQLDALGFLWSGDIEKANAQAWENHYQKLVAFHKEHGHTRVPKSMKLYSWCGTLRVREKYISEERKKKLAKIGFEWTKDIANAHVKNWERRYRELAAFKKKHGHTSIPLSMEELYNWTLTLKARKRYLSEERIARLNKIGFLWTGEFEITRWEKRYQELVEFKKKYGHTTVPMSMKGLFLWCLTLRQKEERVSPEHKQRLNKIGFRWSKDISQEKEQQWLEKFNKLKTFFQIHGHCRVPEKETKLYGFLKYQRKTWRLGTITPEHKKMLRSIGFKIK